MQLDDPRVLIFERDVAPDNALSGFLSSSEGKHLTCTDWVKTLFPVSPLSCHNQVVLFVCFFVLDAFQLVSFMSLVGEAFRRDVLRPGSSRMFC